ncbi:MAG: hypothetical protein ACYC8S_01935 [Minisyncoccota bacterium]
MDRQQNISFIPKAPLNATTTPSRPLNPLFAIALTVFIVSVAAAVGGMVYVKILQNNLDTKNQKIDTLWKDYDQTAHSVVDKAEGLNAQLGAVKEILDNHATLTPFFAFLQAHTFKTIQFTNFAFQKDQTGSWVAKVSAVAPGYMDAALQREELKKCTKSFAANNDTIGMCATNAASSVVSDFAISVPTLTDQGVVTFDLMFTLNHDALLYRNAMAPSVDQTSNAPVPPVGQASTTTP